MIAETARLWMRHFIAEDLQALHQLLSNAQVMRFSSVGVYDLAMTRTFLDTQRSAQKHAVLTQYAVGLKVSGVLIGFCGFFPYHEADERAAYEMAYRFLPEYWGQGYATEAVRALLAYAWQNHGLREVVGIVAQEHAASVNVLGKIGFVYEQGLLYKGFSALKYAWRMSEDRP